MVILQETPATPAIKTYTSIICWNKMRDGRPCDAFLARVDIDGYEATLEATRHVKQRCKKCGNWYSLYEFDPMR